ncbi:uncharacterized protein [Dysidea avara]|uniref:uncharacterized protein isoform X3 n=1 Tax=Dysidea avara TaxID=196820 RepID=UPI0033348F6E
MKELCGCGFKAIAILCWMILIDYTSATSCIDHATVQQKGTDRFASLSQVIVPRTNFTCNGRITGITASMIKIYSDGTDPYLQVWHPTSPRVGIFDKVDEVQLVESEVVQVGNGSDKYWFLNMSLIESDRIEFEAGDAIGYYHPTRSRYNVWSIRIAGYRAYRNNMPDSELLNTFNLNNYVSIDNRRPLIQIKMDIRCDILSTPSDGGMSCSSGRGGVGYEGDTCSFTCNTGYELTGSDNRTCQSNGSWSGTQTSCEQGCLASINVYQGGVDQLRVDRQLIIPYVNCSNSDGRITHITASLSLNNSGSEYPSFQVWRPMSGDPSVYERIGDEIVLEDSEVRAMDGYWLAEIVAGDNDRIEFKSGDVIGCYHPSNVRYQVNTISGNGSSIHDCDGGNMTTVNTSSESCIENIQQLLLQILFDVRCDILSTPSNGGMSCSSGRVGVGYEGDTCSFTCNTGYELTGSDTRTCQSNGSWNGTVSICRKGATTCNDKVRVQQRGNNRFGSPRQVIVPRANFTCSGRITGITASLHRVYSDGTDPYFELWHPTSHDLGVFDKVDEVQLVESKVIQIGHDPNDDFTYWVVNITLNDDDRIEFEAGDVIGYYHPARSRYNVWSITTSGYRGFANNFTTPLSTINLNTQYITGSNVQPLIQFTIDIRCDNLSTPSNGGMSCSSGRVGVGYEGDTCSFTCNTGYELTGSDNRTCQSNGSWSGKAITCPKSTNNTLSSVTSNIVTFNSAISSASISVITAVAPSVVLPTSNTIIESSTVPSSDHSIVTLSNVFLPTSSDVSNDNRNMDTSGIDDTNITPIIVGPVLAVVCILIVLSTVCVCVFLCLRKQSKQKQYDVNLKAATHYHLFELSNPSYEYIDDNQTKTNDHLPATSDSIIVHNPIPVSDYEMPAKSLERARAAGMSFSFPNDYSEPLFDSQATPTVPFNEYSSPLDTVQPLQPARQVFIPSTSVVGYSVAFVPPSCNLKLLLAQIKQANAKMVSSKNISTIRELGCGEFGVVTLATWSDDGTSKEVAVKTLNHHASSADKIKFFQEAAIMAQFFHDNIIRLYGIVSKDPVMIVLEYAKKGDLRNYLIELQPDTQEGEKVPDTVPPLLLKFAREIAAGMNYLSNKNFVHRDLAARNVLLTEQEVCKIADFGMSRDLEDDSYYITSGGKIPAKWTAPEVLNVLRSGYRLPPPSGCPKLIYKLMIRCWHPHPKSRPASVLIVKYLNKPDEELLHISDEDIQQCGEAAVGLGNTLLHNCEELYHELQSAYKNYS